MSLQDFSDELHNEARPLLRLYGSTIVTAPAERAADAFGDIRDELMDITARLMAKHALIDPLRQRQGMTFAVGDSGVELRWPWLEGLLQDSEQEVAPEVEECATCRYYPEIRPHGECFARKCFAGSRWESVPGCHNCSHEPDGGVVVGGVVVFCLDCHERLYGTDHRTGWERRAG